MKLAIVTPLPPQHTGIADYSFDLLGALIEKKCFDITIISNADVKEIHNYKVYSYKDFSEAEYYSFDLILYQVGNNYEFHGYMLKLVKKFGGVIHLHDIVLHHLFAVMLWANNKTEEYFNLVEKNYGNDKLNYIREKILKNNYPWESAEVIDLPLFEEFIKFCDGCIVHSEFAKGKIEERFPILDVYKIQQLYRMNEKINKCKDGKVTKFGIFGGVDPQKKVDVILKAFQKVKELNCNQSFIITIVGSISDSIRHELNLQITDDLKDQIKIIGRVNEEEFMRYFLDTDVLIALRYPTMGETSAVVMRALQLGIPCIVNDIGWYSELPDHVSKISIENMQGELESSLLSILNNEYNHGLLNEKAIRYSKKELLYEKNIEEYTCIIKSIYEKQENKLIYKQLGYVMDDLMFIDNSHIYTPVIKKLEIMFNLKGNQIE